MNVASGTVVKAASAEASRKQIAELERVAKFVRYLILRATTQAGSGHPTSSLSATELLVGLLFGGAFHYDVDHPSHPNNDRLIFSKGDASPLYYALWAAAGQLSEAEMPKLDWAKPSRARWPMSRCASIRWQFAKSHAVVLPRSCEIWKGSRRLPSPRKSRSCCTHPLN